ncbi:MAG: DUF4846 domain-containing protein [Hyphomicrobiaceae bacterium]
MAGRHIGKATNMGSRLRSCILQPRRSTALLCLLAVLLLLPTGAARAAPDPLYPWHEGRVAEADTLAGRIAPPPGFRRIAAEPGSFGQWLRGLPMKPAGAPVLLFNGLPKFWSDAAFAVLDIDVGDKDLQQCADAIMRLRAEYLRAVDRSGEIAFDFTNGGRVDFARWARGERPVPRSSGVSWKRGGRKDASYASFRLYLERIYAYAGTYSLDRELRSVPLAGIRIGDVFIKGGFPGHAVLVADMVENAATGERRFLLIQSFMPAQDMHVLRNPAEQDGTPWYRAAFEGPLETPEWTFPAGSLKRWP